MSEETLITLEVGGGANAHSVGSEEADVGIIGEVRENVDVGETKEELDREVNVGGGGGVVTTMTEVIVVVNVLEASEVEAEVVTAVVVRLVVLVLVVSVSVSEITVDVSELSLIEMLTETGGVTAGLEGEVEVEVEESTVEVEGAAGVRDKGWEDEEGGTIVGDKTAGESDGVSVGDEKGGIKDISPSPSPEPDSDCLLTNQVPHSLAKSPSGPLHRARLYERKRGREDCR